MYARSLSRHRGRLACQPCVLAARFARQKHCSHKSMPRANAGFLSLHSRTFTVLFKVIETPKMRMVSMSAHRAEDGGRMNHHVTSAAMQTAGFFREILLLIVPRINLCLQARLNVRFAGCTVRFCKLHAKRNDWSIDKRWPSDPASTKYRLIV
jgi:hypothetical protein